ncbi:MAG TPA: acyltransferase domain-containing protein [Actinomycetes bacterium]|nr:acyltransferase domain-containing protein [Actinomycetes bacterium]
MLVVVAPGQGAQTPGFLSPWLELPGVLDRLRWLSACAGLDLVRYGTQADTEEIRDTAVAQPLLVGAGLVTLLSVFPHPSDAYGKIGAGAGHSVGELTAAAASGVLSAEQAMVLVRERGRAMAAAAAATPTGMTAVLGGERDEVLATISKHGLTAANDNGAGQLVAAGTLDQLDALAAEPPAGARLRPLQVAGAFHTEHMAPAVSVLAGYARAVTVHDPRTRLISNADGAVVHHGRDVLARIVNQVANPVRWDLCMQTMADLGVTALLEIPPAGTLAGLAKRALPGVEVLALKTPDDLPAAVDLVARHGTPSPVADAPTWRLLVAPSKGTFRRAASAGDTGAAIEPGSQVGSVVGLRDEAAVIAPHGGTVVEWLVEDGDPVGPGQPIVRLHPQAVSA